MKPWTTLDTVRADDGALWVLQERDGVYVIRVGGRELMSSARHGSEEAMADLGLARLASRAPAVLVGGLGLGYTVRAALDRLPSQARLAVVELSPAVVAWNRGPVAALAGSPLDDARVSVHVADLGRFVSRTQERFDAILVDVDNGPVALAQAGNQRLYGPAGLAAFRRALRPAGTLVVWSAGPDARFLSALRKAGFEAEERRVGARQGSSARHVLFLGRAR